MKENAQKLNKKAFEFIKLIENLVQQSINMDKLIIDAKDCKKGFSEMYRIDSIIILIKNFKL
jgi:hypothetical protein